MSPLNPFLATAKRHLQRSRAIEWAIRGATVTAIGAAMAQLASRWWPVDPWWAPLVAMAAVGVVAAVAGWLHGAPSLAEVARIVDRSLGGSERLSTAWELAAWDLASDQGPLVHGNTLVSQQWADAETWVTSADPRRVGSQPLPRRALAMAVVASVLAAGLALLPNHALTRLRAQRDANALRDDAADEVAALAAQAARGTAGDPARRRTLLRALQAGEQSLREARTTPSAVAALTRTQRSLRALVDSSASGRRSAAAAAGTELARAAAGAGAGSALAAAGGAAGEELQQMAEGLSATSPEDQAAMEAQLREAADAAADPAVADALRQAADELNANRPEAAKDALAEAARNVDQRAGASAANELSALAKSLADIPVEVRGELAQALDRSAAAAAADPALAEMLAKAAAALKAGNLGEASAALDAAGQQALGRSANGELDADVSRAGNSLQSLKDSLLASSQSQATPREGEPARCDTPDRNPAPSTSGDQRPAPQGLTANTNPAETIPTGPGAVAECQVTGDLAVPIPGGNQGSQSGRGVSQSQDEGEGQGQGTAKGKAEGESPGKGGGEGHRGGGGTDGGAQGALAGQAAVPTEKVYVPGLSGPGRVQSLPGSDGDGSGADGPLVPASSVYAQYRAAALTQSDRQLVPERMREWLREYFQEETS